MKKPTLEVLRNGKPIFEDLPGAGDHFSFGRVRAIVFFLCRNVIKEFVDINGEKVLQGEFPYNDEFNLKIDYRSYLDFERTSTKTINKPYLVLHVEQDLYLKFGLLKSKALLELMDEIVDYFQIKNTSKNT